MLSSLLIAGCALLGQAAADSNDELAREVRALVRDLNAAELAVREAAQEKLIQLGPAVLDLLPEPTPRTSAEEKQRLAQIRDRLQRVQAVKSVEASLVTLQGKMPLSKVFSALEEQTGNVMIDHREQFGQQAGDPTIEVSFNKTPFWQAVDQVMDLAGLTTYAYPERDGVAAVSRPDEELPRLERPASYSGAFRLEAVEAAGLRGLRIPSQKRLQLQVEIAWEPRLKPISLQYQFSDVEAVDEHGKPLEVEQTDGVFESPINPGELTSELNIPLALPERSTTRIARLKGKFMAMVPGRLETFRFENLTQQGVEQRKAGVTVILDQVRKNADVWEVRVLVRFDKAGDALESHRGWIFNNEAYLETPDKQRIDFGGFETTRQTRDEVGMAYVADLPKGPAGLTLVYKTPSVITLLPVEYELKDLPLP